MQRNILITAVALVILGMGAVTYFYFFAGTPSVTVTPTGDTTLPVAGQTPSSSGSTSGSGSTQTVAAPGSPVVVTNRLVQISDGPVVPGAIATDTKAANASSSPSTTVTYIERQSGNVFSYLTSTHVLTRINNKTVPGIQSATWFPDGLTALVRYLSGGDASTINTYALAATSSTGFFLSQNLADVAVSSAGILTLASGVNGSAVSLSRLDGTHPSTIFTTPLTSLRIAFAGKNQYLAFSKPSSTLAGDAFLVNSSGRFSRVAGPLNGLVALSSPSGKWFIVSYTQDRSMRMELVNTSTGTVTVLPISTIADKCVWAADENSVYCGIPVNPPPALYPDEWYQGAIQFSDRIWKIHIADHYAQLLFDFSQANRGVLDATALTVNPANTVLVFMNKNDGSLWSYSL